MEYSFQNSLNEKPVKAILEEFELTIDTEENKKNIPYASITEVRLGRKKDLYYTHIISQDYGTLLITNRTYESAGEWKDQSRTYHTFIRVLHMHLQNKSKASFYSGFSLGAQALKLGGAFLLSCFLFLAEEYFDVVTTNSILISVLFFGVCVVLIVLPNLSQWPKNYQPTDIPLNLLPPA